MLGLKKHEISRCMQKKIARWLLEVGAVTLRPSRPFTWASGIKSPIYCDNRLLLSYPKARSDVIEAFEKIIGEKRIKCDAIAGVATAGIPYAAILADHLKKPMLYVRSAAKDHGKGNQIEGCVKKGARVLVIEDLVSTGKSSVAAIQALKDAGARVTHCLAVFSYQFKKAEDAFEEARCRLQTLTDLETLLALAVSRKIISKNDRLLIEKFSQDPEGWLGDQ